MIARLRVDSRWWRLASSTGPGPLTCAQPAPLGAATPATELDATVLTCAAGDRQPLPAPLRQLNPHTLSGPSPPHDQATDAGRGSRPCSSPGPSAIRWVTWFRDRSAVLTFNGVFMSSALRRAVLVADCSACDAATELPTLQTVIKNLQPSKDGAQ